MNLTELDWREKNWADWNWTKLLELNEPDKTELGQNYKNLSEYSQTELKWTELGWTGFERKLNESDYMAYYSKPLSEPL